VDVRTEEEFKGGALAGAINVPHDRVGKRLSEFGADKDRTIVVYCRSGRRSGLAKAELEQNGFKKVINAGGIGQLQAAKPTK
jgi:phage shock protein E